MKLPSRLRRCLSFRGLTLIEVMITLLIVGPAMIGVLEMAVTSVSMRSKSSHLDLAIHLAYNKMIEVEADPERFKGGKEVEYEQHPNYRARAEVKEDSLNLGSGADEDAKDSGVSMGGMPISEIMESAGLGFNTLTDFKMYNMEVEVFYKEGGGEKSFLLQTYRNKTSIN